MATKANLNVLSVCTSRKNLNKNIPTVETVSAEELPDISQFLLPAVRLIAEMVVSEGKDSKSE